MKATSPTPKMLLLRCLQLQGPPDLGPAASAPWGGPGAAAALREAPAPFPVPTATISRLCTGGVPSPALTSVCSSTDGPATEWRW